MRRWSTTRAGPRGSPMATSGRRSPARCTRSSRRACCRVSSTGVTRWPTPASDCRTCSSVARRTSRRWTTCSGTSDERVAASSGTASGPPGTPSRRPAPIARPSSTPSASATTPTRRRRSPAGWRGSTGGSTASRPTGSRACAVARSSSRSSIGSSSTRRQPRMSELRVDEVDLHQVPGLAAVPGRLGMTFLPGKQGVNCLGQRHERDLDEDVATLRSTRGRRPRPAGRGPRAGRLEGADRRRGARGDTRWRRSASRSWTWTSRAIRSPFAALLDTHRAPPGGRRVPGRRMPRRPRPDRHRRRLPARSERTRRAVTRSL